MVLVQKSGGTVYLQPSVTKESADISISMHYTTAIQIRDELNEMFPKEPCAVDISQKQGKGT